MKAQAQRLAGAIVLAFAAAAILAGGALATPDAFERAVNIRLGVVEPSVTPDAFERAVNVRLGMLAAAQPPDAFERAVNNALRPDDRGTVRGPAVGETQATAAPSLATPEGFQWDDAAVGAGVVFGVLMLGAAVLLTIRHRGRVILP